MGTAAAQQAENGVRQVGERADDPVGAQLAHWGLGIAEVDRNDRYPRRALSRCR